MFSHFSPRHIPALIGACGMTFGGMFSMVNARASMLNFGLPTQIADVPATSPVWVIAQARTTTLGILMFTFYFRRQLDVVDIIMATISGYAALIDSYVVSSQGYTANAAFRLVVPGLFCVWGLAGMTARR